MLRPLLLIATASAQPAPGWVPVPPPISCGAVEQPNNTFCIYLRNNCTNVVSLHLGVHTIPGNTWAVPPAASWANDTWFSFPSLSLAPNASKGFGDFSVNVFYNATLDTGHEHTFGFGCIFSAIGFDCSFNPGGKRSGFDAQPYLSLAPPSLLGLLIVDKAKAAAPPPTRGDCGFGGVRVNGACACRPEWGGPNCTQLSLLPAPNALAFSSPSGNVSSWGGSVQRLRRGGYAMAVAVMAGHCGLDTWEGNSEIVLARAATPDGPFAPQRVILAPFAHNPTLHHTLNGSLLIAHIGQGAPYHPLQTNCTGGFTPRAAVAPAAAAAAAAAAPPLRLGVPGTSLPPPNYLLLASGDPDDGSEWVEINSGGGGWAANNPALWLDANGSALLVYKVHCPCPPPCTFCAQFGVATAPGWEGPFTDRGLIPVWGEDAYVWRDPPSAANGGFHMLFQGGNYAPLYPAYTGHWHTAFSADGLAWEVEVNSVVFSSNVTLVGGGELALSRRERHQVLLDEGGAPAHLYNGAMAAAPLNDHVFTVGQPIAR